MMRNKVIFISGEIASGKSSFATYIRELGYKTVDTDQLARDVVKPGTKGLELLKIHFPSAVVEGELDREILGNIVFKDDELREHLNALIHPLVTEALDQIIEETHERLFVEVPLIHSSFVRERADLILYLKLRKDKQLERLMERSLLSEEEALSRIRSFKKQWHHGDVVILNNGNLQELKASAKDLVERIV